MADIELDLDRDEITLFGVKYALGVFRHLGFGPIGSQFKIVERDSTVVLETIQPASALQEKP